MSRGIMVFSERPELRRELLGKARQLANATRSDVGLCVPVGSNVEFEAFAAEGADVIYTVSAKDLSAAEYSNFVRPRGCPVRTDAHSHRRYQDGYGGRAAASRALPGRLCRLGGRGGDRPGEWADNSQLHVVRGHRSGHVSLLSRTGRLECRSGCFRGL